MTDAELPRAGGDADLYVERESPFDFDATLQTLEAAVENAGLAIFARVDHAAAAREVGLEMPPTTVLIYGNPRGGTPIMLATPRAALDLPLKVLVREDETGRVFIGFHPIAHVLQQAGVPLDVAKRLEPAQALLFEALAHSESG